MASFYAEFEVEGRTYPVRWCRFGFEQATHERGRVRGKVRHGLLQLTLDVPDGDQLLTWANTPDKALAGHVTFFETNQLTARETVGFATGHCVGYDETFASGDGTSGAYVCRLVIAADKLELMPGGPARPLAAAAAREYIATKPVRETVVSGVVPELLKQSIQTNAPANPMNPERMKLWMGYLARRGVQFLVGTPEAQLKLYDYQAEGLFTTGVLGQTIYLHDPPGTAAFFEEAFHALQHLRKHPATKMLDGGQEVDAWEYDAKMALLKHSEKLGLSYEEYIATEHQLQQVIDNEYGNYNS